MATINFYISNKKSKVFENLKFLQNLKKIVAKKDLLKILRPIHEVCGFVFE